MKIEFLFAWYDLWIGFFWNKEKKWLYILPLPCTGIILKFSEKKLWDSNDPKYPWNLRKDSKR